MRKPLISGISFGMSSGVITTLGLLVGLYASTQSKLAVIGGVLTIAIADSFSDALGIHISKESDVLETQKDVWVATLATFFAKLTIASTFILPVIIMPLYQAVLVSFAWGVFLLTLLSIHIAKTRNEKLHSVIGEHLTIGILVITLSYVVGDVISKVFK